MHTHVLPNQRGPIIARVARAAAFSLCRAAARLYRAAQAMERGEPPEEELRYVRGLLASHGKLD
jgi:hypothetical protein